MSSIRVQIAQALLSAWNVDERPDGVPELVLEPFRQQVVTDQTPVRCGLYFLTDDPTIAEKDRDRDETGPARLHEFTFALETRVCGTDDQVPFLVADPIECWAVKAWNDNPLGGLVTYLRTGGTEEGRSNDGRPNAKFLTAVVARGVSQADDFEAQ